MENNKEKINQFWNCKTIISYILAVFVFQIHIPTSRYYQHLDSRVISVFSKFMSSGISSVAVSLFFIISGVCFFRNYDNSKYLSKLKSRFVTLAIPYVIWNILGMLFNIITTSPLLNGINKAEPFIISARNIFMVVFHNSCNVPFWFIFDLICFAIVSPLFFILLKNKISGIIFIAIITILEAFNIGIPESLFFADSSLIYYSVGAYVGLHYFQNTIELPYTKKIPNIAIIVLLICLFVRILSIFEIIMFPNAIETIFYVVFACSFWITVSSYIVSHKIKAKPIMKSSFMLYAIHVNSGIIISKALYMILPKSILFFFVNYFATVFIVLLTAFVFHTLATKKFPVIGMLLLGASK